MRELLKFLLTKPKHKLYIKHHQFINPFYMECELTTENAKTLDRISNTFFFNTYTISTTTNTVLLQIIQEDNTLICNITLNRDFFKNIDVSKI